MTEVEYNKAVDAWSDDVYRFSLHSSENAALSRDAVQEAYASLWQKRSEVPYEKAKAYLFQVSYHYLMAHFRHAQVVRRTAEELKAQAEVTSSPNEVFDLRETMRWALRQLPEVQRALLQLRDMEGYSTEELCKTLDLSTQQVATYLFRARAKMKKLLIEQGYEPSAISSYKTVTNE